MKEDNIFNMELVLHYIAVYGYVILFVAFFLELIAMPLPGESIMVYVGYLIYQDKMSLAISIMAVSLGAMIGITVSYFVGSKLGSPLFHKYGRYVHMSPERLDEASNWFGIYGNKIIVVAYFIPGLRHISGYLSGILQIPFRTFAINAYIGALLYAGIFIYLGKLLGPKCKYLIDGIRVHIITIAVLLVVLFAIYLYWKYKKQTRYKSRS